MLSFITKTLQDDLYGEFNYISNSWVNSNSSILGYSPVKLILPGNRFKIAKKCMSVLLEFETEFESEKSQLAEMLFNEHYLPCKTAIEQGILKTLVKVFPEISTQNEIWHHVKVLQVRVNNPDGKNEVEVVFEADWDVEQTMGFIFKPDESIEFRQNVAF